MGDIVTGACYRCLAQEEKADETFSRQVEETSWWTLATLISA